MHSYQQEARRRGFVFDLDEDTFARMTKQKCAYCGQSPQTIHKARGKVSNAVPYIYNGIDRVDNLRGYIVGNCVPCCPVCNRAKTTMGKEEFLSWAKRVVEYCADKGETV